MGTLSGCGAGAGNVQLIRLFSLRTWWPALVLAGYRRYRVPEHLDVLVDRFLQDAFLVAVRAVAAGGVFLVDHRADAVAVHAFGAEEGHVGRAGAHHRDGADAVDLAIGRFDGAVGFRIQARGRRAGALIAGVGDQLDRRVVDHLAH